MQVYAYKVVYGCGHTFYSQTPRIHMPCPKCGYRTCSVFVFNQPAPEGAEVIGGTIVRFQGYIAKSGDRYFIYIPKALHEMIIPYLNKVVTVTLED